MRPLYGVLVLATVLTGLATGLSLIVAIGAQNAFVLRQGIRREHVGAVVAICAVCDLVLIAAGVAGVGALIARSGTLLTVLKWAGAGYLVWFGIRSLSAARRPTGLRSSAAGATTLRGAVLTALALTLLNPHVYLDTVLMLGNIANQYGPGRRWWFAGGAMSASLLWFTALGFGARAAAGWLGRPSVWRWLDVVIGLVMFAVAAMLLLG